MVIQAFEYESAAMTGAGQALDLSEFFDSVRGRVASPIVQQWVADLEQQRRSATATTAAASTSTPVVTSSHADKGFPASTAQLVVVFGLGILVGCLLSARR